MQISNSVFLVTGGASGLGAATARLLGSEGAKVVLADVNEAQGKRRGGAGAIGVSDR
jgi:NAD(P)-dependent dehydrogenase (short-subunit alcohol dehydrogenase family)